MQKKKITVVGGGNGTAICLRALKPYANAMEINAVVSTSDSGGSSGRLRREFNTIPTGDIMRAVLGLSRYEYNILRTIFYRNRFGSAGKLDNHNLGNLFLTLSEKYSGTMMDSLRAFEQAVEAIGHVYPVTLEPVDLYAGLSDGTVVKGEADIDVPKYERSKKIVKVWIDSEVNIDQGAKGALESADYIFFGPGSLYTSILPNLLVRGAKQALERSNAKLIYVIGSCFEADGETGPEKLTDFIEQLQRYLPRPLDAAIYSTHEFSREERRMLEKKRWSQIIMDTESFAGNKIRGVDFEYAGGGSDPGKLGPFLKNNVLL